MMFQNGKAGNKGRKKEDRGEKCEVSMCLNVQRDNEKHQSPMLFLVSVLWKNLGKDINLHKKGYKDFFFLQNYNTVTINKKNFSLPTL